MYQEQEEIVEENQKNPIEVANEDELYKNEQFVNLQAHQLRNDCNQVMGLELEEYNPEDYTTTASTTDSTIAIHNIEEIQQENQVQPNQLEEQINPNEELVNELIEDSTEIVVTVISQEVILAPDSDVKSKMDLVLEELLARKKSKETTSDSWSSYSESSYWSENSDNYSTSSEESSFYDSEQLAKDIALASDDAEVSAMTLAQKQELHNSINYGTNADQEKSIQAAQIAPITSIVQDLIANIATARLTAIGVGAGDEDEQSIEKGLWARVIGGVSTQKALKDLSGYKGKAFGGSIGADIELNDDLRWPNLSRLKNQNLEI